MPPIARSHRARAKVRAQKASPMGAAVEADLVRPMDAAPAAADTVHPMGAAAAAVPVQLSAARERATAALAEAAART